MASFTDMLNDLYTITNRTDMVNESILAIKTATLKAHQREFYFKDLFETGIQFPTSAFYQSIEPKNIVPNYRTFKYLRKYDAVALCPGKFLKLKTTEQLFDGYGNDVLDIYYAAGIEVNMRMSTQEQYMLMGVYVHPVVLQVGYSSWIADEYPDAILHEAASRIYKILGEDSQANDQRQLAMEAYMRIDMSNITMIGS
jgi:hypothetical protein